jgi:hypothetical protein
MRYLILVKADADTEAGVLPAPARVAAMTEFHEALARAGVLLDAAGLQPSAQGWRIRFEGGQRQVSEGPFALKDLACGYTLVECKTREEALEWTRRFPLPQGEIEVRPLMDLDEPGPR